MDKPITENEVRSALKKMKKVKAAGSDWISAELLKYGPDILVTRVTSTLNSAFKQHADLKLGHGILVPLQKLGKRRESSRTSDQLYCFQQSVNCYH